MIRSLIRHRGVRQLVKFGLVGGTGVVVNLIAVIVCNKLGPDPHGIAADIPWSRFNVRNYHVYATIAFLVANLWNFQLNRAWTFRTSKHASWLSEYGPFLLTGLFALAGNLAVLTALLHPGSPLALPQGYFDDSSGLRNRLYWGQLIAVVVVTPVTFLVNKYWTFTAGTVSAAAAAAAAPTGDADAPRSPATPAP